MRSPTALVVLLVLLPAALGAGEPKASLHESFETPRTAWQQEETDATIVLQAHDRSERAAHDGRLSEHFRFEAQIGSALYYSYRLPKIPVTKDLRASLYVRANQSGIQLFARVILPADKDPETGESSFLLVPGTSYDTPQRWQRLELADLLPALERQARVLRAASNLGSGSGPKRLVSLEGAYLDRLVVNLYGGPGVAEVFLDDLTISPVPASAVAEAAGGPVTDEESGQDPGGPETERPAPVRTRIKLSGNRLSLDGADWVPTIVRAPGADPALMHKYGCDILALEPGAEAEAIRRAVRAGFFLMPRLDGPNDLGRDPHSLVAAAAAFPVPEAVAFWSLGEGLGRSHDPQDRQDELTRNRAILAALRELPEGLPRLATATIAEGLPQYSLPGKNLDLIGIRMNAWGASQEPLETVRFLAQRRERVGLNNLQGLYWAWVPMAAPPELPAVIWGRGEVPAWGYPRVQPEQIRLYTYAALAAGYRGIGFWGDAELGREAGRARRYEMALLNAEIDLVESIIARGADPILLQDTWPPDPQQPIIYNPLGNAGGFTSLRSKNQKLKETPPNLTIKAARIATRDHRGCLLLVADYALGAQFQPPQMAANDLKLLTQAPEAAQAWQISLGEVRHLERRERVPGGIQVILDEFDTTALVLVTTDFDLVRRLEQAVIKIRPMAVEIAIQQAQAQIDWVTQIHKQLALDGHYILGIKDKKPTTEGEDMLQWAHARLQSAREAQAREDYPTAWAEARRVGRGLRQLMSIHFAQAQQELLKATKASLGQADPPPMPRGSGAMARAREKAEKEAAKLARKRPALIVTPVSCPPLVAFNTLPQHYI
ncbi:MAG: hypothetical protein IRY99_09350, partial [Isosphaeraceae bacterium]|nr:hypothetical protein [Isosphaeraceae bacterium]